jgi:anaerobic selenocysteine-containing dehydrogenase
VIYTRVGTCNSIHGTLATYANDLLNLAAGRLGAEGGAMFPEPALDAARIAELSGMNGHARWRSRVRGLPETASLLPAATLAEEMETAGPGQVRALLAIAGNPVLSTPNGPRLARAIGRLEFVAAIDLYITETTRHADVILPPCWTLAEDHMEPLAESLSLRSHLRWSPPVLERGEGELADWEILLRLTERLGGGPTAVPLVDRAVRLAARLGWPFQPSLAVDFLVRTGRHGDRFLPWSDGLSLEKLRASAHGVDRGLARAGISHRVSHRDRKVHLAAAPILDAMRKLAEDLVPRTSANQLLLIGRRHVRSNNSWMHNLPSLVSGRDRCVLLVHPLDAARLGIRDGESARMESAVHKGAVPVRVSDEIMPGVVSLPHGWGHGASGAGQQVAAQHAGVSVNDWTDDQCVEAVVGQSVLNGVPITLHPLSDN